MFSRSTFLRLIPFLAAVPVLMSLSCRNRESRREPLEIVKIDKLTGPGFSMKVPAGLVHRPDILRGIGQPDAKAVFQETPGDFDDAFMGSIVVTPVLPLDPQNPGETFRPVDEPENCLREMTKIPLKDVSKVPGQLPPGAVCQVSGQNPQGERQKAIITLMKQPGQNAAWVVTCNFDRRDKTGPEVCAKALGGWEFVP